MIKLYRWGIISVPKVGIEPTFLSEHDFESCASACSATPAGVTQYTTPFSKVKMKLGIIGLPQSGKTTLFNALTRGTTPTHASAGRMEVHTHVVDVPDPRVDTLSAMFKPRKTIYAKITYADIAGLEGTAQKAASRARCSTRWRRWTRSSTWCAASKATTSRIRIHPVWWTRRATSMPC